MIKTNKVKLEIHYDHINRDYDLYRIQQNKLMIKMKKNVF